MRVCGVGRGKRPTRTHWPTISSSRPTHRPTATTPAQEVKELAAGRFSFINVWRGINETPIYRMPLAMADTRTVPSSDFFTVLSNVSRLCIGCLHLHETQCRLRHRRHHYKCHHLRHRCLHRCRRFKSTLSPGPAVQYGARGGLKALPNPNHLNSSWVPLQYELIFPDRVGQNYSLKFSEEHKW